MSTGERRLREREVKVGDADADDEDDEDDAAADEVIPSLPVSGSRSCLSSAVIRFAAARCASISLSPPLSLACWVTKRAGEEREEREMKRSFVEWKVNRDACCSIPPSRPTSTSTSLPDQKMEKTRRALVLTASRACPLPPSLYSYMG